VIHLELDVQVAPDDVGLEHVAMPGVLGDLEHSCSTATFVCMMSNLSTSTSLACPDRFDERPFYRSTGHGLGPR
jgi:hypothetical protein